jgi:glycosyltransferase involved in cell wall biosynthesis
MVDDGASDNSPVICDEYSARDERFRIIHQRNGGASVARNVAMRMASGEYFVFLDSDDFFIADDSLENLHKFIEKIKEPVIWNSHRAQILNDIYTDFDGHPESVEVYTAEQFYELSNTGRFPVCLLLGVFFYCKNNLFFKENSLHEDLYWMPRVVCASENIAINHSIFHCYRMGHPESITTSINPKKEYDKILIIKDLLSLAKNTGIQP